VPRASQGAQLFRISAKCLLIKQANGLPKN
jgi:hypothetical protein